MNVKTNEKLINNKYSIVSVCVTIIMFLFSILTLLNVSYKIISKAEEKGVEIVQDQVKDATGKEKENTIIPLSKAFNKSKHYIKAIDSMFSDNFVARKQFIELFGMFSKVMDKKVFDDILIDNDNFLQNVQLKIDAQDNADSMNKLNLHLKKLYIPLLYIQAPSKVISDYTILPPGFTDYTNSNIDSFLSYLSGYGIEYMDLRKDFLASGFEKKEWFYKTDHHWTIKASFLAYLKTIDKINDFTDMSLDNKGLLRNESNYLSKVYSQNFLGSQGQKISHRLSGLDDFIMITPNFHARFKLSQIINSKILHEREGEFIDSLLYMSMIETKDLYSIESYTSYLGYGNTEKRIINYNSDNNYRVLVIGDSFSRPFTAFLSTCFQETRNIDTQSGRFNENVYDYIVSYKPNLVIVLVNGRGCGNSDIFKFDK